MRAVVCLIRRTSVYRVHLFPSVMYERALQLEKSRENTLQWDPESRRLVDRVLEDVYTVLQPTKEQRADRRNVVQFVDTFVKQRIQGMWHLHFF